ncbi:hypothetical protein HQQ80_19380 [Microbacteriaceae bacterium VKM Ac-2855]|nr:hypothetical protein [Microbacteriaceae bacterium VKM Ac-2855]
MSAFDPAAHPPAARRLEPGETNVNVVEARIRRNDTRLDVDAGAEYEFVATGEWTDWHSRGDADGLDSLTAAHRLFSRFRRRRDLPWFSLLGSVGRSDRDAFLIGTSRRWRAPTSGRLFVFANDMAPMYFNNRGQLRLTVARIR